MKDQPRVKCVLSETDKEAFLAGLKAGLGLTHSAGIIRMTAQEVSEYLIENTEFLQECEKAVKYSAKVLLVLSNTYLKEKKYRKWKENNEYIRLFISNVYLWESYCRREEVTNFKAAEAYAITRDKQEAATICGMTIREYNTYLLRHPNVKQLIEVMLSL